MSEQTGLHKAQVRHLSPTVTLALLASIVISFLAASSAPTPLYAVYQSEWTFGAITTTTVFGIYAVAVLVALLTFGRLSDHVGRRPVLLVALVLQAASMVVFIDATGVGALYTSRVVQGLATGAALGAIGAALLDVDRARGTMLNSVAPPIGTAAGAIVSGLLVQYLPAPTTLVYAGLLAVFVLQGIGVLLMTETVTRARGALRSLRPEIGVPARLRGRVLTAAPVLLAVWALAGFYGALSPAIITGLVGHRSFVLGGLGFFALAAAGAVGVLLTRTAPAPRVMVIGVVSLVVGVAVTQVGIAAGSLTAFFVGTAVAGIGFGAGFQGGLRLVVPEALPHERAGVLSVLYVVSYFAMGVPAVIGGVLVANGGGLDTTALEYGAAVVVLALVALGGLLATRRTPTSSPAPAVAEPRTGCAEAA